MEEGKTDDWKYTLKKSDWTLYSDIAQQKFKINLLDKRYSGDYQCCGLRKDSDYKKCSNRVSIRLSDRARATLTAATTTVSVGDRVTLICSVEKSAGWRYEWFRRTSHTSEDTINDGLNGNIRVSQGGIYRCRGGRGEPAVYSDPSDEVTIQITFSNKVSVTQKPSWSQIFRGERITLTSRKPKAELKITKSPVGGRVTLSCSVKPSSSGWSFFWFRGEKPSKLLRTQDADFLSNGQIRVSQGGVYRCRGGRGEPVYHTEFSDPVTIGEFKKV
uniref:Ig-like domain-containing protein n=1 Tax=Oryzias latipes TaxID=8090 RepID=A0A3P9IB13_ORYLA